MVDKQSRNTAHFTPDITSKYGEGLSREVARFVQNTSDHELPEELKY